jgi:hypothetical protein
VVCEPRTYQHHPHCCESCACQVWLLITSILVWWRRKEGVGTRLGIEIRQRQPDRIYPLAYFGRRRRRLEFWRTKYGKLESISRSIERLKVGGIVTSDLDKHNCWRTKIIMSLFKGASRSVIRATSCRPAPLCCTRRAASSMTAESQQKVCRRSRTFNYYSTNYSSYSLRILRPQTRLSGAFSITCNSTSKHATRCWWQRRRNADRNTLSISSLLKTLHPRLSSMLLEVLCKVRLRTKVIE